MRETASAAVAVLVRICGEHLAVQLTADFKSWAQHQLPTSKASHLTPTFVSLSKERERLEYSAALQERQRGGAADKEGGDKLELVRPFVSFHVCIVYHLVLVYVTQGVSSDIC